MVGFHFSFQLRIDREAIARRFDERAKDLGCPPPGGTLRPWADRATVSGSLDRRLSRGALRYDWALFDAESRLLDVRLGRTEEPIGIRFGVDRRTQGDWCSSETLGFSSAGIFMPEQRTADNLRTLQASFVAQLDLWATLDRLAEIAMGAERTPLTSAPDWRFAGESTDLVHEFAGLSSTITPMISCSKD